MRILLVIIALSSQPGCDAVRDIADRGELEAELRDDPGRPGKVGSLVAVDVHQHAVRAAVRARRTPDARCALTPAPQTRWSMRLDLTRRRSDETVARWRETRTLTWDEQGGMELTSDATFTTSLDIDGVSRRSRRLIDDQVWNGRAASDGMLWHVRQAERGDRARILSMGPGTLQGLIDAVDGWSSTDDAGRWTTGSDALRCAALDGDDAFVDRFVAQATIEQASLVTTEHDRRLTARWRLANGATIDVDYRDELRPAERGIAPPPADRVVPIERDRSLPEATALLEKLAEDGLARLPSDDGPQDESHE